MPACCWISVDAMLSFAHSDFINQGIFQGLSASSLCPLTQQKVEKWLHYVECSHFLPSAAHSVLWLGSTELERGRPNHCQANGKWGLAAVSL